MSGSPGARLRPTAVLRSALWSERIGERRLHGFDPQLELRLLDTEAQWTVEDARPRLDAVEMDVVRVRSLLRSPMAARDSLWAHFGWGAGFRFSRVHGREAPERYSAHATLYAPLRAFAKQGRPILGTCAGAVLLAREVENHPVESLGLLDVVAVRNAYGTQVDSFAAEAESKLGTLRCVFIRAPQLRRPGPEVEVLARLDGWPVFVRQGSLLATTFHPELSGDPRVHAFLLELAG